MEGWGWGGGIKGKQSAHVLPSSNRAALLRSVLHEAFRKGWKLQHTRVYWWFWFQSPHFLQVLLIQQSLFTEHLAEVSTSLKHTFPPVLFFLLYTHTHTHTHTQTWHCKSVGRGRFINQYAHRKTGSTLGISSREGLNTGNWLQMYREPRRTTESRSVCPEMNTTSSRAGELKQGRWCYQEPRSLHSCWQCCHKQKNSSYIFPTC